MTQAKVCQNKKLHCVDIYNIKTNFLKMCSDCVLIIVFTRAIKLYFFHKLYIAASRRGHTAQHKIP